MKSSGQTSHTEQIDFARFIAPVIRKYGFMTTGDVKRYIAEHFPLCEGDMELRPNLEPRWEQIVRNLKSNKVFDKNPDLGVLSVKGGFQYVGGN